MKPYVRYIVSVWRLDNPEPDTYSLVLPGEQWGDPAVQVELIEIELRDMLADNLIGKYTIQPEPCDDINIPDLLKKLEQIREDEEA